MLVVKCGKTETPITFGEWKRLVSILSLDRWWNLEEAELVSRFVLEEGQDTIELREVTTIWRVDL